MTFIRSTRWILLALVLLGVAAQHQASAQIPVGTTRTGTFIWDGERWIPAETPPPPAPIVSDEEVTVDTAPPPLPVYEQPPCPAPNLIWTPGHWRWGLLGYYWVPGAWVPAPYAGALWTPSYWGWVGGRFTYHEGYWGPHIGFYGGVNYGGGYMGIGFAGGSWNGGVFAYNTAVVRVNASVVTNVYVNRTIVEQTTIINTTNVSYNGGPNGVQHQATSGELVAVHEQHQAPTTFQRQHVAAAAADKSNFAKNNGGRPANLAVSKPLAAEPHTPPAGFKPPPSKPLTELAKVQAPPETVAAARTATTKTATVAKPAPRPETRPEGKTAPEPMAKPAPKTEAMPETKPAPRPEAKPETRPEAKTAPEPMAKPVPKTEAMPETKPAPRPEVRPEVKPEARPEAKPAPKPAPRPEARPEPKPAPKPGEKPKS
jgi:hypothetical protein